MPLTLTANEKLIHHAKPHWITLMRSLVFVFVGTPCLCCALMFQFAEPPPGSEPVPNFIIMPFVIFGTLFFGLAFLSVMGAMFNYSRSNFYLTNKRVIFEYGIFYLKTKEIYLHRINGVSVDTHGRGGYGTIIISAGGGPIELKHIPTPMIIRDKIQTQISGLSMYKR